MPITTPQELREHLELAIRVELSTVPPYLYAMYSIEDQTSDAALLIRSVVAEEMLHATLASNLLLAVGGRPDFGSTDLMPTYPSYLAHHIPPLQLRLAACSRELISELFLMIEKPEAHEAIPESDEYETLGQFYHALELGISELAASHDLFADPQPLSQLSDASFYTPVAFDADDSGGLLLIDGLESALEAIEVIIHQGEGVSDEKWADPQHRELTHYHKFLQLADGEPAIGTVAPVPANPQANDLPGDLRPVADLFNAAYRYTYLTMDALFNPSPDKKALVRRLYGLMSEVMSPIAHYLVTQPVGDQVAAPTFEVYDFDGDSAPNRLLALADNVAGLHPALASMPETIRSL